MRRLSAIESRLLRGLGSLASPGRRAGSLLVLIYHQVLPVSDPLLADEPDAERFAAEMDLIKDVFNVLTLGDAVDRLGAGALPPRALSITFDDGYANNLHLAAPILAARGLSATFFVATGFIGGGQMWNDTVIEAIRHAPRDFDLRDLGFGDYQLVDVPAVDQAPLPQQRLERERPGLDVGDVAVMAVVLVMLAMARGHRASSGAGVSR